MDKAFTLDEATDIAEDFSDMEGTGIIMDMETGTIQCQIKEVVVAPYPDTERAAFVDAYTQGISTTELKTDCKGDGYEVLIIGTDATDGSLVTIPIRDYTRAYGVRYNYP